MFNFVTLTRQKIQTPWGTAQTVLEPCNGIKIITTAGHGGWKLDRATNAKIPKFARRKGGWYEEDCEWAIAAVCLYNFLPLDFLYKAGYSKEYNLERMLESARRSLQAYYPELHSKLCI